MVNNLDWTAPLTAIDFLRDIGKHFRIATMLKKDAVSARLASSEGISFTEFSYQILQGMDFLQLYRDYDCVLQTGGSDQWGNLTSGLDLVHRVEGVSVHAIGTPLITTSDGKKFGKSEGNAIWLEPSMTSPYAFYQFWLNTEDADVVSLLKIFTFLEKSEIERLEGLVRDEPFRREAQRVLAREVTSLVHGAVETEPGDRRLRGPVRLGRSRSTGCRNPPGSHRLASQHRGAGRHSGVATAGDDRAHEEPGGVPPRHRSGGSLGEQPEGHRRRADRRFPGAIGRGRCTQARQANPRRRSAGVIARRCDTPGLQP